MHKCKHCKRVFEKETQLYAHEVSRRSTGRCRKSVKDSKDMRVKAMIQAFRDKTLGEKEEVDESPITYDDVEGWS